MFGNSEAQFLMSEFLMSGRAATVCTSLPSTVVLELVFLFPAIIFLCLFPILTPPWSLSVARTTAQSEKQGAPSQGVGLGRGGPVSAGMGGQGMAGMMGGGGRGQRPGVKMMKGRGGA